MNKLVMLLPSLTVLSQHRQAILNLMQAIDDYIPDPVRALDRPFSLPVEDVFSIQGRGTVVTGRIEQGIVKVGEQIEIIGIQPPTKTTVTGVLLTASAFLEFLVHVHYMWVIALPMCIALVANL